MKNCTGNNLDLVLINHKKYIYKKRKSRLEFISPKKANFLKFTKVNKKSLSERDMCSKFINPSIEKSGWNMRDQVREEFSFIDGKVIVQGQLHTRGKRIRRRII